MGTQDRISSPWCGVLGIVVNRSTANKVIPTSLEKKSVSLLLVLRGVIFRYIVTP